MFSQECHDVHSGRYPARTAAACGEIVNMRGMCGDASAHSCFYHLPVLTLAIASELALGNIIRGRRCGSLTLLNVMNLHYIYGGLFNFGGATNIPAAKVLASTEFSP